MYLHFSALTGFFRTTRRLLVLGSDAAGCIEMVLTGTGLNTAGAGRITGERWGGLTAAWLVLGVGF